MSPGTANQVPAVVVGGGINGLGVVRSLARAHVPIIILDSDARQPGMRSRFGRKVTYQEHASDAIIVELEKLAAEMNGEQPLLILTKEETVAVVSAHRQRLQHLYRLALPDCDVLSRLMHKNGFRALAAAADAPIPRSSHITQADHIQGIGTLRPPLVVKPSFRNAKYSSTFRKAYRVDTVGEAQDLVSHILPVLPDVVVQEWIEGSDSDIYFCLLYITRSDDVAVSFVGRKIRSWPPRVGGTASCAPASKQEEDVLTRRTTEFFRHAKVRGFASMEYKRDVRSGEFFMVEPTVGRTDYQEEVATLNGINIPLAAYQAELGLELASIGPRKVTRIWRHGMAEKQSALVAEGDTPWRPDNARTVDALRRMSDPMPAILLLGERVSRKVKRMVRRLRCVGKTREVES